MEGVLVYIDARPTLVERDRDDIESTGLISQAAPREKVYRHPGNPVLLQIGHGGGGSPERVGRPGLDLHEHDRAR